MVINTILNIHLNVCTRFFPNIDEVNTPITRKSSTGDK